MTTTMVHFFQNTGFYPWSSCSKISPSLRKHFVWNSNIVPERIVHKHVGCIGTIDETKDVSWQIRHFLWAFFAFRVKHNGITSATFERFGPQHIAFSKLDIITFTEYVFECPSIQMVFPNLGLGHGKVVIALQNDIGWIRIVYLFKRSTDGFFGVCQLQAGQVFRRSRNRFPISNMILPSVFPLIAVVKKNLRGIKLIVWV
jgi:hypothetical protein